MRGKREKERAMKGKRTKESRNETVRKEEEVEMPHTYVNSLPRQS